MSNTTRTIAYNSLIQLAGRVIGLLFTISTVNAITAALGPDLYGEYGIILGYLTLVGFCADVGLTTICAREMARDEAKSERVLANSLALRILLGLVAVPAALLLASLYYPGPDFAVRREGMLVAAVSVPLQLMNLSLTPVFQVRQRMVYPVIADLVMKAVLWGGVLGLTRAGDLGLHNALIMTWAAAVVNLLVNLVAASRLIRLRLRFDLPYWRWLLVTALPLGLGGILNTFYFRVDLLMLGRWHPSAAAGTYRLATNVYEYSLNIPAVFITTVFPILVGRIALGDERVRAGIQRSFDFLVMMGVPIAVGTVVLAAKVAHVLTADPVLQTQMVAPAQILVVASAFSYLASLFAYLLVAIDRQRDTLMVSGAILVANVGLNVLLIPRWAAVGAAWATFATECVSFLLLGILVRRRYGYFPALGKAPRVFFAAGVMGAALWWVDQAGVPFRLSWFIGLVIYGGLALALGVVDRDLIARLLGRRNP